MAFLVGNVEPDITRDAKTVSWAEIWECSLEWLKSQHDIIDAVTIAKIIVFDIICYVAWYSAAKFTFQLNNHHPVSLWRWPLTCNLEKCYSLRSSFGMYNLERRLRYLHLMTRHCPCNLLPEPTSPKHEYKEELWDVISMENIFWHNLGCFFHIWGQV